MTRAQQRNALMAGILIFLAPLVWIVFQQGLGAASYLNCHIAGPPWGGLVGAIATMACAAAAGRCWLSRARVAETRRFLMVLGAGSAAIFALAALTMTVAIVMVPACAR